jgi:hypothetical protein
MLILARAYDKMDLQHRNHGLDPIPSPTASYGASGFDGFF